MSTKLQSKARAAVSNDAQARGRLRVHQQRLRARVPAAFAPARERAPPWRAAAASADAPAMRSDAVAQATQARAEDSKAGMERGSVWRDLVQQQ
eukprot:1306861-Pleurochrysis_carterae.AAC.3